MRKYRRLPWLQRLLHALLGAAWHRSHSEQRNPYSVLMPTTALVPTVRQDFRMQLRARTQQTGPAEQTPSPHAVCGDYKSAWSSFLAALI